MTIHNLLGWAILVFLYIGFAFVVAKAYGKILATIIFTGYPLVVGVVILALYLITK